jgi:hypothetical protein
MRFLSLGRGIFPLYKYPTIRICKNPTHVNGCIALQSRFRRGSNLAEGHKKTRAPEGAQAGFAAVILRPK